jgi:hypothetical protein
MRWWIYCAACGGYLRPDWDQWWCDACTGYGPLCLDCWCEHLTAEHPEEADREEAARR